MALGTIGAIVGSAVIGAGASIIGSNKAAKASKQATEASNELQAQIYGQNAAALAPYQKTGGAANNAIAALLGLPTTAASNKTVAQAYFEANPNLTAAQKAAYLYSNPQANTAMAPPAQTDILGQQKAAFDQFRNSTGYQFRLNEGQKSLTAALGGKGLLDSGAAQKAALQFGQNAASSEFGNWYNMLAGQQGVGLTAASAQAGVGQNFANAVTANNANNAAVQGNAALSNANSINGALNSALSAFALNKGMGSSYGGF